MSTQSSILVFACVVTVAACNAQRTGSPGDTSLTTTSSTTRAPGETTSTENTSDPDRGTSEAETRITSMIRDSILHDKELSLSAKNVQIIANGTAVTLRGNVNSEHERAVLVSLARRTDGVTEVNDQLEVKARR